MFDNEGSWRNGAGRLLAIAALALVVGAGRGVSQEPGTTCGTTNWELTAGQTLDVGTVTVSNDEFNLYITYTLDDPDYPDACLGQVHAWAGTDLTLLPGGGLTRPPPGQLCSALGGACADATGLQTYTFTIPFPDLSIVDVNAVCGATLYVVTHAEVDLDCTDSDTSHETGFGGPTGGPGPGWWFYGAYTICCDFGEPDPPYCQTAFAKGTWVWTTDKKSNPENLSSLKLTKNRWGWAINLTTMGTKTYDIWAGCGLNKTANGIKVGTLTVNWDGTDVLVTYTMATGYCLAEVHLYAGDASPTTTAPGQYGNLTSFDPHATEYTFDVPLANTNGTGGVWIIAHAVVCDECE